MDEIVPKFGKGSAHGVGFILMLCELSWAYREVYDGANEKNFIIIPICILC